MGNQSSVNNQIENLEENAAANLDDAVAAAAAGDFAKIRAVHRCRRSAEVSQIEDVHGFAAELELELVMNLDIANQRCVDIPVARIGELGGALISEKIERADARASRCCSRDVSTGYAIGCRIEPRVHLGIAVAPEPENARSDAGNNAGAIIRLAIEVVVHAGCYGEGLALFKVMTRSPSSRSTRF